MQAFLNSLSTDGITHDFHKIKIHEILNQR